MINITRAQAQDRAIHYLTAAEKQATPDNENGSANYRLVEVLSALGTGWATLAATLPNEAIKDRPFSEAANR